MRALQWLIISHAWVATWATLALVIVLLLEVI